MQNLRYNILQPVKLLLLMAGSGLCQSCDDIFEKDVSDKKIVLVAPGESVVMQANLVEFRWEEIDENTRYRLQVAKPSFELPERFWADTLIPATSFQLSLPQGLYQWRVRAENNSSHSEYTTRSFRVDSITDLSQQIVILRSPADNAVFASGKVLFKWEKIGIANDYRLEVREDSWTGEPVFINPGINSDTISATLAEGNYVWAVKAQNDMASTQFSPARRVQIDLTAPQPSIPVYPGPGAFIVNFPVSFQWAKSEDNGSEVSDSLYIMYENGVPVPSFPPRLVSADNFSVDSLPAGRLIWRIKSIDAAGNKGATSSSIQFTVQ